MLQLSNVEVKYQTEEVQVPALRGVTLELKPRQFTALVGKSGSGKTTLLQVAGLLQKPTQGQVSFDNQDASKLSDSELSHLRMNSFGFIFQNYHLVPVLNCLENITLPAVLAGSPMSQARRRAKDLLEAVGLKDFSTRNVRSLSGGQKQRVAVARALINEPRFIFADEPTASLDSETGKMIMELLIKMAKERNKALILATHDTEFARLADSLFSVADGKVNSRKNLI
jgi:putative ABC transport system ATP-binding protein